MQRFFYILPFLAFFPFNGRWNLTVKQKVPEMISREKRFVEYNTSIL